VLTETRAICTYLEGLYPEPNLMGVDFDERAFIEMADRRVELYLLASIANCIRHTHPGLAPLEQPQFPTSATPRAEGARDRRWLDGVLARQPWWPASASPSPTSPPSAGRSSSRSTSRGPDEVGAL
jgi:glutathione S-transferase